MGGTQQIDKLIRKNLLIKARRFKSTLFELALPLVLFGLLAYMRQEYNKTIEFVGPKRFGQESVFPLTRRLLSFAGDFVDSTLGNGDSDSFGFSMPSLCGLSVGNETVAALESSLSVTVGGRMVAEELLQLDPNATAERVGSALRMLQDSLNCTDLAHRAASVRDELLNWTGPLEHALQHVDGEFGELLAELRAAPGDVLSRDEASVLIQRQMEDWVNETCSLQGPLFEKWNKTQIAHLLTHSRSALNVSANWLEASADWLEAELPDWLDWLDNSSALADCLTSGANLGEVITCFNATLNFPELHATLGLPELPHKWGERAELRQCINEGGNLEACFNFTLNLPELFMELDGEALRKCLHEGGDLEALVSCFNVTDVDLPSFARLAQDFIAWAEERDGVFNVSDLLSWANISINETNFTSFPQWVDEGRALLSDLMHWFNESNVNITLEDAVSELMSWINRTHTSAFNASAKLESLLTDWLEHGNSSEFGSKLVPLIDEFLAKWNITEWNMSQWFDHSNISNALSKELVPMLQDLLERVDLPLWLDDLNLTDLTESGLMDYLEDCLENHNLSHWLNHSWLNHNWLNHSLLNHSLLNHSWFNISMINRSLHSVVSQIDWLQNWTINTLAKLDEGMDPNADIMEVLSTLASSAFVDLTIWSATGMQELVTMADEFWPQILGWNFTQQIELLDSTLRYISHFVQPGSTTAMLLEMLPNTEKDSDKVAELRLRGGFERPNWKEDESRPWKYAVGRDEKEEGPIKHMMDKMRDGQFGDLFQGRLDSLLNMSGAWGSWENGSMDWRQVWDSVLDGNFSDGSRHHKDQHHHGWGNHSFWEKHGSKHRSQHGMSQFFHQLINTSRALLGNASDSHDLRQRLMEWYNKTTLQELLSTEFNISKVLRGGLNLSGMKVNLSGLIHGHFNMSNLLQGNLTDVLTDLCDGNTSAKMEEALSLARTALRLAEDTDGAFEGLGELMLMLSLNESNFTVRGVVEDIRHIVRELNRSAEEVEKEVLPKWTDLWHEQCKAMNVSKVSDVLTRIAVGPLRSLALNRSNYSVVDMLHLHKERLKELDTVNLTADLEGLHSRLQELNASRVEERIREWLTVAQVHVSVDANLTTAKVVNISGALDELFCRKRGEEHSHDTRSYRRRGERSRGSSDSEESRADDDEDDREENVQGSDYLQNELLRRKFLIAPWKGEVKELYELLLVEMSVTAFDTELGEADEYPWLKPLLGNPVFRGLVSQALNIFLRDRLVTFETERELETYSLDYPDDVFAAVVFRSVDEDGNFGKDEVDIKYAVRLHAQLLPSTSRILRSTSYTMFGGVGRPIYYYLDFGFAWLQDSIGRAAARLRAKRAAIAEAQRLQGNGFGEENFLDSHWGHGRTSFGGSRSSTGDGHSVHGHQSGHGYQGVHGGYGDDDDDDRGDRDDDGYSGSGSRHGSGGSGGSRHDSNEVDDSGEHGGSGWGAFDVAWGTEGGQPSEISLNIQAADMTEPIRRVALGTEQFPIPLIKLDAFIYVIQYMLPLLMILGWIYAVSLLVKEMVYEKQERLREVMRIQGLKTWVYWSSWLAFAMAQLSLLVLVMTALLSGGGVLTHSNPVLIFLFFWVYSLTVVSMAMLISACFQRAKVACVCAGVAYYSAYLPFYIFQRFEETAGFSAKCLLCLMGPTALGAGMGIVAKWELVEDGLQWNNLGLAPPVTNTGSMPKDGFALTHVVMMMFIDSAIYQLLAWYIEKVFPGELGLPQPWYFCFQRSFWRPTYDVNVNSGTHGSNAEKDDNSRLECYEPPSGEAAVAVQIRRLMKKFPGGKVALKGISLDMHTGTILGLLGHNGAGKSTTMSILTGLYPPTGGDVLVNGVSVRKDSAGVRNQLGVCPQHNALYEVLTVREHLDLFCNLKGVPRSGVKAEVDNLLQQTGLGPKTNAPSRALSGGMKRKLSIGIALAGGSKVIALDEPTAGVDATSRRDIWHLLAAHKPGRAILLSTHFMDEADVLSDRIAIIAEGELTAIGSSMSLKKRFADRYLLTVVAADGADTTQLWYAVRAEVPEAKYVGSRGREYSYALPSSARSRFAQLFGSWQDEKVRERLGVETYGLSASTMEEVFLQASSMHEEGLRGAVRNANVASEQPSDEASTASPESDSRPATAVDLPHGTPEGSRPASAGGATNTPPEADTPPSVDTPVEELPARAAGDQVEVLDVETNAFDREYTDMVEPPPSSPQCMVGSLEDLGGSNEAPKPKEQQKEEHSTEERPPASKHYEPKKERAAEHAPPPVDFGRLISGMPLRWQQFMARMGTRAISARRDRKAWASQLLLPASFVLLALGIAAILEVREEEPPLKLSTDMFTGAVSGSRTSSLAQHSLPYTQGHQGSFGDSVTWGFESAAAAGDKLLNIEGNEHGEDGTQVLEGYLMNNTRELRSTTFTALSITGASDTANVTLWFDNRAQHAIPAMLSYADDARFHMLGFSDTKTEVWNHPLPKTQQVISEELTSDNQAFTDLTVAVTVLLAMGFIPASFLVYLVHEKATNAKHQQLLSGVSPITFWLSSYCWDLINFLVPVAFVFMLFLIFQLDAYSGRNAPAILMLLITYGTCMTPVMYCIEPLFVTPSTAYVTLIVTNIFTGTVSVMSISVLQLYANTLPSLKVIGDFLEAVYPWLLPNYCLGRGMVEVAANHYIASAGSELGFCDQIGQFLEGGCTRDPLSWNVAGQFVFYLFVMSGVWLLLRLLIEWRFFSRFLCPNSLQTTGQKSDKQDEGVLFEASRVETLYKDTSAQSRKEASLLVSNLYKSFAPFRLFGRCSRSPPQITHSVRGISVAVAGGECFGLLGVNGAGKTTTMRMITGDIEVGKGDVRLSGWSVKTHRDQARRHLGYCPQFDALPDLLTAREALSFYARVRGVPAGKVSAVVESTIGRMCLEAHQNRLCYQLSGGNRRKLSTAIALIGEPDVVLLDEPSTGVDVGARRFLWDVLGSIRQHGHALVLTSHSMDECEVLWVSVAAIFMP